MSLHLPLAFGMPGPFELTVILVVVVLLFGRRLPGVARSVGRSVNEFKGGLKEGTESSSKATTSELTDGSEQHAEHAEHSETKQPS